MSNQYGPRIVTNGLVLCLDAGNSKSYPGSGTVWNDLSGNGNNGTLVNGPTYSSASKGSIAFDGTDDKVDCGSSSLNNLTLFSLILWIRRINNSPAGNGFDRLLSKRTNAGWWELYISTTHQPSFAADFVTTDLNRVANNTIVLNQWNMITCTWTGAASASSVRFYINNIETSYSFSSDGVGARVSETTNVTVIGNADFGSRPFYGNISNALVYNRVLSANEVSQNYKATKGRFGL